MAKQRKLPIPALPKTVWSTKHADRETTAWRKGSMSRSGTFGLCSCVFKNHHLTLHATFLPTLFSGLIRSCSLTELQPVARELPFVGVIREPFTLLIHGHVLWVQDHGQVARLQIATIRLKRCKERERMCVWINGTSFCFSSSLSLQLHFPVTPVPLQWKGAQSVPRVYVTYGSREWPCCSWTQRTAATKSQTSHFWSVTRSHGVCACACVCVCARYSCKPVF